MATMSCTLSEEQLLCSICLEVFSAPVTTPCGHSFCRACINQHWDNTDICNCPICKQGFSTRPQMKVNTVLAEMVYELKHKSQGEMMDKFEPHLTPPGHVTYAVAAPGEVGFGDCAPAGGVACDVCHDLTALKSCTLCMASYCENDLQPHLNKCHLRWHPLVEPYPNLAAGRTPRNIFLVFVLIFIFVGLCFLFRDLTTSHHNHDRDSKWPGRAGWGPW